MNRYIVIILTTTPYETNLTADAHNVILSASAFFDEVKVIFSTKEAYYQLYKQIDTSLLGYKNILKSIKSFQWYDIESVYILEHVTNENTGQLPLSPISDKKAQEYIKNSTHCFIY